MSGLPNSGRALHPTKHNACNLAAGKPVLHLTLVHVCVEAVSVANVLALSTMQPSQDLFFASHPRTRASYMCCCLLYARNCKQTALLLLRKGNKTSHRFYCVSFPAFSTGHFSTCSIVDVQLSSQRPLKPVCKQLCLGSQRLCHG